MEAILLTPAMSLETLNSVKILLAEYLKEMFSLKTEVHVVQTENGRGLQFLGTQDLALFWEREFHDLPLVDGSLYLSRSPLDEDLLRQKQIEYQIFNDALFVEEIPILDEIRETKIKEGWHTLKTSISPLRYGIDSSFKSFFKYINAQEVHPVELGFVVKLERPKSKSSLDHEYQSYVRNGK